MTCAWNHSDTVNWMRGPREHSSPIQKLELFLLIRIVFWDFPITTQIVSWIRKPLPSNFQGATINAAKNIPWHMPSTGILVRLILGYLCDNCVWILLYCDFSCKKTPKTFPFFLESRNIVTRCCIRIRLYVLTRCLSSLDPALASMWKQKRRKMAWTIITCHILYILCVCVFIVVIVDVVRGRAFILRMCPL